MEAAVFRFTCSLAREYSYYFRIVASLYGELSISKIVFRRGRIAANLLFLFAAFLAEQMSWAWSSASS